MREIKKEYKCNICGRVLKSKSGHTRHQRACKKEKDLNTVQISTTPQSKSTKRLSFNVPRKKHDGSIEMGQIHLLMTTHRISGEISQVDLEFSWHNNADIEYNDFIKEIGMRLIANSDELNCLKKE